MDNLQKIEKIVSKAGCSYEEAKTALEANSWDMIDAIISLERDGKIIKETAEKAEPEKVEAMEVIPEVTVDRGSRSSENAGSKEEAPKKKRGLWKRIKGILMNNRMVVFRSNGQQIINLPILAPVIALIAFFWATLAVAVVAMIFGYRFHFEGEDLGKTNINSTMDKATDYAEKVKKDLTGKVNGKQDSDN